MPERTPRTKAGKAAAVEQTMHEFKKGTLHSGSKHGPKVKSREQAQAIAMSQSGQSKYDRSSHHPGNPGFPSSSEAGGSPPKATYAAHEAREKEVMGAGYEMHERAEDRSYKGNGSHNFQAPKASNAHGFRSAGHVRQGHLRLSGHSGAHRIGKR